MYKYDFQSAAKKEDIDKEDKVTYTNDMANNKEQDVVVNKETQGQGVGKQRTSVAEKSQISVAEKRANARMPITCGVRATKSVEPPVSSRAIAKKRPVEVSKKSEDDNDGDCDDYELSLSDGERLYLEKQRKRRAKRITYWTVVAVAITMFLGAGTFFRLILGSSHRITESVSSHTLDMWNIVDTLTRSIDPLVRTFSAVFISFLIMKAIWIFTKFIGRRGSNRHKTILAMSYSFVKYIVIIVTFIAIVNIWIDLNAGTILAGAGILGIMIGFGAQNLLADILAGLFIVFEDSFEVGDIIVVAPGGAEIRGEVIHIGIRTTMIKGKDGNVTIINNSDLRMVINQSQDQSLAVVNAVIEYDESLERVEKIINDAIPSMTKKLTDAMEIIYLGATEYMERGVQVRIIARCDETVRLPLTRELHREVKAVFDQHGIVFAVSQVVVGQKDAKVVTKGKK